MYSPAVGTQGHNLVHATVSSARIWGDAMLTELPKCTLLRSME